MHHGAVPLAYGTVEKPVQAVYLKGRIVGRFFHVRVTQRMGDIFGDLFPAGTVYHGDGTIIKGISKKQYLEIRGLHIFVQPRLLYVNT